MASTINASNTGFGGIVSTGDSSGSLALQAGGTTIATVSSTGVAVTGNVTATGNMLSNGPTFSAYPSGVQSIPNATWTKLAFQVEEWDTANCFDSTTNYRFTPNVAGYYQLNGSVQWSGATFTGENGLQFYKNGTGWKATTDLNSAAYGIAGSCLVYLNGTTDYVELYAIQGSGGAKNTYAGTQSTFFQAALIRGA